MDDDKLIYQRLKSGDQSALRVLVERYHSALFAFLFRLMDEQALADDFTQQTFIRVLTYQGDAPDNLRAWMFTIARNLAYDYFRSAQFHREQAFASNEEDALSDGAFGPEQLVIRADEQHAIAQQLQQLPHEQREVVILRFYHDLSLQEIAQLVEAPLGTVKSRLFHALKKLKHYLVEIGQAYEQ